MFKWLNLSLLIIVADQIAKYLAEANLSLYQPVAIFPFFNLTLAHNPGAAFSFLADAGGWQRWFFLAIALMVSCILFIWLYKTKNNNLKESLPISLILGGAIGNIIDRFIHGYVIDFIDLYYKNWHWPAFNIADSAITVGVTFLVINSLAQRE
ncbi:signal peptidase II [Candidatus Nitrosacidococcus tergens]|uniref:Lipoprotein signal peptidase n=1 Tax=Candidatus Nitrosacidococcus tergens TaxID=553981 RepID=A0A7G1Q8H3_9GAMM|nr:signal peptidase II [Candidatus Nitrosacidococcus tergens]CAB1275140.1 prolipoprotein signal peptidase (signal peptidase II) [Candidatus Nitrosacidococcus tergens]